MTVREIYSRAMRELKYDNGGVTTIDESNTTEVDTVNSIYAELFYQLGLTDFKFLKNATDEIDLPEKVLNDCMHYGVAMKIAFDYGDSAKQQYFAQVYNAKMSYTTRKTIIKDNFVSPFDWE